MHIWAKYVVFLLVQIVYSKATNKLPDPGKCGSVIPSANKQIYGGTRTNIESYPWTVILVYREGESKKDLFKCGGSLISERYVLTAAHCLAIITPDFKLNRIRLGEWDIVKEKDCDSKSICSDPPLDVGIESMVLHEKYDSSTIVNDIALIKLDKSVSFTKFISPVCLPLSEKAKTLNTDKANFFAVGWGATEFENGTYEYGSRNKLEVSLKGVSNDICSKVHTDKIFPTNLCAGAEKGKDTCHADSGGGLISIVDNVYYEYGIISWGEDCGLADMPGVYTRVTNYLDWILKHLT